ncbi:FG-GAP repeat protein [Pseudoalteromonas sp. P1-9]|uniref:FG-GAP repeat domain-containing protein n=1 Tax=Pseudoalteromonas sp. P1-9 TaxID=1710354 RepID=UPI0006D63D75|nr:VCBS repeat-containing protein [Pseudoalteromonas sp. P1-9]KPV96561.1 FG-GAP repeat protein [Pseudoalteromonas sp. P1-9]
MKNAINQPSFELYIEPDPFAAELLTENIAQYGVLLLREAGTLAKQTNATSLSTEHLIAARKLIADKTKRHAKVTESNNKQQQFASAQQSDKTAKFVKISQQAKFNYQHRSADWLNRQLRTFLRKDESTGIITIPPAFGGSGVATEDVNNDGLIDIFILGGRGNKLFINKGNGQFKDLTTSYKLDWQRAQDNHPGEARQPIIADINNDGYQDIIVTYVNDAHRVYKNIDGIYFEDVTQQADLGGRGFVGGPATVFDFDKDGDLDLYITYFGNYITGDLPTLKRRNTNGKPNQLFENLGNFKFKNVTKGSGLDNTGWAQAVAHTDLNNDGWQDVIVGNDFGVMVIILIRKMALLLMYQIKLAQINRLLLWESVAQTQSG